MNGTKKLLRTITFVAAGLFTCLLGQAAQASTVAVGTCKPNLVSFSTIQAAVNSVPTGSTVDVCPGYYAEQVTITTNNLTLLGIAAGTAPNIEDAAVIIPPSGGLQPIGMMLDSEFAGESAVPQIIVKNATGVTISHIIVDGQSNQAVCGSGLLIGIYYQNSSGTVTDSVARNQNEGPGNGDQCGWGIAAESASASVITISNNSVRNFQKNGIVVRGASGGGGPVVTATLNTVIGSGAISYIAQNGIEIGFGASVGANGVKVNYVADLLYTALGNAATGILFYSEVGSATVQGNVVESSNIGIGDYFGTGTLTVSSNHISGTQVYDGIDLCSGGETAESNLIFGSTESGIHIDDGCGGSSGTGVTVKNNTINEACTGLLLGTGGSNVTTPNTYENDGYETQPNDTCTLPSGPSNLAVNKTAKSAGKSLKPRP